MKKQASLPMVTRLYSVNPVGSREVTSKLPTKLKIAFYPTSSKPVSDDAPLLDKLRAKFEGVQMKANSPNWGHCNMVFGFVMPTGIKYTTYTTNLLLDNTFLDTGYESGKWCGFDLNIEPAQVAKLFAWALATKDRKFNKFGVLWNFLPCVCSCCAYDARGSTMFCAEQVVRGLQHISFYDFAEVQAYRATPDIIYDRLQHLSELHNDNVTGFQGWTLPGESEQFLVDMAAPEITESVAAAAAAASSSSDERKPRGEIMSSLWGGSSSSSSSALDDSTVSFRPMLGGTSSEHRELTSYDQVIQPSASDQNASVRAQHTRSMFMGTPAKKPPTRNSQQLFG